MKPSKQPLVAAVWSLLRQMTPPVRVSATRFLLPLAEDFQFHSDQILKSSDWLRFKRQKNLFGWTSDVKNLIGRESEHKNTWLTETIIQIIWLVNFKGALIWLVQFSINVILRKCIAFASFYTHRLWESTHDRWTRTVRVFSILHPKVENAFWHSNPNRAIIFRHRTRKWKNHRKWFFDLWTRKEVFCWSLEPAKTMFIRHRTWK